MNTRSSKWDEMERIEVHTFKLELKIWREYHSIFFNWKSHKTRSNHKKNDANPIWEKHIKDLCAYLCISLYESGRIKGIPSSFDGLFFVTVYEKYASLSHASWFYRNKFAHFERKRRFIVNYSLHREYNRWWYERKAFLCCTWFRIRNANNTIFFIWEKKKYGLIE